MNNYFNRNSLWKIILAVNLILVLLFVLALLNKFLVPLVHTLNSEVTVQPVEADKNRISYPFVRVMPKDPQYRSIYALEKFKVYNDDANDLFLAKKRVAEILEWGSSLEIAYSLPIEQFKDNPLKLITWWNKKEKSWYLRDSQTTFNFWEVEIARYASHIESYLESGNKGEAESALKKKLTAQRELLDDMSIINGHIDKMNLTDSDKRYLLTTSTLVFDALLKKTKTLDREELGISQFYVLKESVDTISDIIVDIYVDPLHILSPKGLSLSTGHKKYLPINSGDSTKFLKFNNVLLKRGESVVSLNYPATNKVSVLDFKLKGMTSTRRYEYSYVIPQQMQGYAYLLDYVSSSSKVKRITINKSMTFINDYLNNRDTKREILNSGPIIPFHEQEQFTKILSHGNENIELVKLEIAYDDAGYPSIDFSNDFVTLTPISKTELVVVKVNSFLAKPQTFFHQENIKWWIYIFILLNMTLAAFLVFIYKGEKIFRDFQKAVIKHIVLLFIIFAVGFITDTFLLAYNFEVVTYALIATWILFLWGSGVNGRFQFVLGSTLLVIAALASSYGINQIAEKAAVWVFIFVGIGIFQLVYHDDRKTSIKSHLASNHMPYLRHIASLLRSYLRYFLRFFKWSFNIKPRYPIDFIRNISIAFVYIIIIFSLFKGIRILQDFLLRQSYDPVIYSQQPLLVYNSTKVVLAGRRFGWNTDKKSKLIANGKLLNVSLWTDTEIVFEIPLDIPTGTLTVRIEKVISWNGKNPVAKSNNVKLRVISRTNGWDEEDDLFFKQLKSLPREIRKINGYD